MLHLIIHSYVKLEHFMHLVEWLSKQTDMRQLKSLGREGSAGTSTWRTNDLTVGHISLTRKRLGSAPSPGGGARFGLAHIATVTQGIKCVHARIYSCSYAAEPLCQLTSGLLSTSGDTLKLFRDGFLKAWRANCHDSSTGTHLGGD